LSYSVCIFVLGIFEIGSCKNICVGWLWTTTLPFLPLE
jgi:hypothetical protein